MTFISGWLLGGLFLAAVPIIIHILNRRRFQVIDWPPMKYLKLTLKKNRRRIRIEQLILLAIRTLAVLLLILAVARPVLSQKGLTRFLLPGRARTSRILVIDDSLSMGYTTAGRSAFQVAQNAAADIIRGGGTQDSLTILLTCAPDRPLVRDASLQEAPKFADLVSTLGVTDTPSNWGAAFSAVTTALSSASFSSKEVVLVTDLRRSGWSTDVTAVANKLARDHVPLRIIDVGDRRTDNVALLKLEAEDAIALPEQPIHLRAVIRNGSAATISRAQATLTVDGNSQPLLLPDLPPGGGEGGVTTEVPLTVSLENSGAHTVSLALPRDALPQDDLRCLCLTVRPNVSVLLIDGEPSAQPFESETDFLTLAYSVGVHPWKLQHATELDPRRLRPGSPDTPDVLVLANVAALSAEQAASIERLVRNGMGLMIFTGELVDPEAYNQRLYRNGQGLLPLKLDRPSDTPSAGLVVEKDPQSPLAPLAKLMPEALARIRTRRYTAVELPHVLPEAVRILAHWNNAENPPAVLQKNFGKGTVLLFTTTAGKKWTDWPLDPTYVLSVRSAALSIARGQDAGAALTAGEPIRTVLDEGQAAIDPKMSVPGMMAPDTVDVLKTSATVTELRYGKTVHAGIYSLSWRDEKSTPVTLRYAVNPTGSESDLEPISESQLGALLGNLKPVVQRYDVSGAGLGTPPREIWRVIAMIVLALLVVEAVFAVWVGRER